MTCCAFVSRLWSEPTGTPDGWVERVSTDLASVLDDPLVVTCAVVECIARQPHWSTLHAHAHSLWQPRAAQEALEDARDGFPARHDIGRSQRAHGDEARIVTSRDVMDAERGCVLGVMPLADDARLRSIVVVIDALAPEWDGVVEAIECLRALREPLVEHFRGTFLHREERRRELLGRLSPTQRMLVPLLVEGLTEEQIGVRTERSRHTIHDHAKRIYRALGISSRHELRRLWGDDHAT